MHFFNCPRCSLELQNHLLTLRGPLGSTPSAYPIRASPLLKRSVSNGLISPFNKRVVMGKFVYENHQFWYEFTALTHMGLDCVHTGPLNGPIWDDTKFNLCITFFLQLYLNLFYNYVYIKKNYYLLKK